MHVALVRCRDVQRQGAEERVAGLLEDWRTVDHAQAEPAEIDRSVRGEHAHLTGFGLHRPTERVPASALDVSVVLIVERKHVLTNERARGST